VDVVHRHYELLEEPARLRLAQPSLAHDVLEHVAARRKLHRDHQVLGREEDLLELDDVGVHQLPVVEDLALHILGDLRRRGGEAAA
jgi:hypothetical protein